MNQELVVQEMDRLTPIKVSEVVEQVRLIQELMKDVMKEGIDEHYGKIPGTKKLTLLKPGAEKLGVMFRLAPEFDIVTTDLKDNHREYRVVCTLRSISSGISWGQGVGSCSTMETRYRYRYADAEDTGKAVPKKYWSLRETDPEAAQDLLGGKGFVARKIDVGDWKIMKQSEEKIENPDIADCYNTVLKIAKKRAHVDAILTATAASDIFTQDMEDFPANRSARTTTEKDDNQKKSKTTTPKATRTANGKEDEMRTEIAELLLERNDGDKDQTVDMLELLSEFEGNDGLVAGVRRTEALKGKRLQVVLDKVRNEHARWKDAQ